jgi:hypothetical protein
VSGLIYVTAEDCHLCEHGRQVLDSLGVDRREIASDSQGSEALSAMGIPLSFLPVLTDGERLIAHGRLSEKRLRSELAL